MYLLHVSHASHVTWSSLLRQMHRLKVARSYPSSTISRTVWLLVRIVSEFIDALLIWSDLHTLVYFWFKHDMAPVVIFRLLYSLTNSRAWNNYWKVLGYHTRNLGYNYFPRKADWRSCAVNPIFMGAQKFPCSCKCVSELCSWYNWEN